MKRKNLISFIFLSVLLMACETRGVRESKTKVEPDIKDTHVTQLAVEPLVIDSQAVNFDTVFNFTEKKPIDSVRLPSGVKLKYLVHGNGRPIHKYDVVAIHYRGMLTNGKIIESNEVFKKPVPFVVGIKMTFDAFDEVLLKCKTGDKIRFVIPAEKAYGKKGRGKVIPPDSDLVYEMDVLEKVQGKKTASGVEYFSLYDQGKSIRPVEGDKVSITYMGFLKKDGKMFDASVTTGKLYEFVLGTGVAIKAWHETVAQMQRGEKVLIIAPAETCYGSRGVPELVPPNSELVYLIELREIEKAK